MIDKNIDENFDDDDSGPSKSQIKKEMQELQELGKQLTELSSEQLDSFALDDTLRHAIDQMKTIKKNEAKRRQLQYIGKLMRKADREAIESRFEEIQIQGKQSVQYLHQAENWRDRLLDDDSNASFSEFISQYPDCDIQNIRQLVRNAKKEKQNNKPPASARKLFKSIREQIETR